MKPLIMFHGGCQDGFAAAYAAWTTFGWEAQYVPVFYVSGSNERKWLVLQSQLNADIYGKPISLEDRTIYVVDFSFPLEILQQLQEISKEKIVVLDHHQSAFDEWYEEHSVRKEDRNGEVLGYQSDTLEIFYDSKRSGAQLVWDYFLLTRKDNYRSKIIEHVGDRDLWKFELPNTKEFCAALSSYEHNFVVWDRLETTLSNGHLGEFLAEGRAILRLQDQYIAKTLKRTREVRLWGPPIGDIEADEMHRDAVVHQGYAANVTNFYSEVGGALAVQSGTYALTFEVLGDLVKCSLRGKRPFEVLEIAKNYGGGGHDYAAGFTMNLDHFLCDIWNPGRPI